MNHTLEQEKGGLVLPGCGRPVAQLKCVREEEAGGEWDLALRVMGGRFSNFHALKTGEVTARKLGCVGLPDDIMDFELSFLRSPWRPSRNAALRSTSARARLCGAQGENNAQYGAELAFSGNQREVKWGSTAGAFSTLWRPEQVVDTKLTPKGFFGQGVFFGQGGQGVAHAHVMPLGLRSAPPSSPT